MAPVRPTQSRSFYWIYCAFAIVVVAVFGSVVFSSHMLPPPAQTTATPIPTPIPTPKTNDIPIPVPIPIPDIDSTSTPPSLSLVFDNEYQSVPITSFLPSFTTTVGIRAPKFSISSRAGIDLVAVLDRSGSMFGDKMDILHKTVNLIINHLNPSDRLAIVAYDSSEQVILPLTHMSFKGKETAREALKNVQAAGSTNLSGGLWKGLNVLKGREVAVNEVTSVLLLTDGLANEGVTDTSKLVQGTKDLLKEINTQTSIYCFGIGSDHNSNLLSSIAESAHGTYYFMKSTENIPIAFGDCLGGLMSMLAQNIVLTVTAPEGITINSISTAFQKIEVVPHKKYTIAIGDMFSEEERDILVDISLPSVESVILEQPLLHSHLDYTNVIGKHSEEVDLVTVISRTSPESSLGEKSLKVDEQRQRVFIREALVEAQALGDSGQFHESAELLKTTRDLVAQSDYALANPIASDVLLLDLDSLAPMVNSADVYQAEGNHRLRNKRNQHSMQRASASEGDDAVLYDTSAKEMMRLEFEV